MATITQLNISIAALTENVHKSNVLDISKSFLSDEEIAINMLMAKNPTMTREEAELMVGTYRDDVADDEESDKNLKDRADEKKLPSEKPSKANSKKNKKIKYKKSEFQPQYPLPKGNSVVDEEVKKTKHDVRYASTMIVKYSVDLGKEVINVTTMMVQSIAGITIMVAAPPWNIPGAITVLTAVINVIISVINKVSEVVKFFPALEKINLVVQPGALAGILSTLKTAIDAINTLFSILKQADKFVSTLVDLLLSLVGKKLDTNRINKFLNKNDEGGIMDPSTNPATNGSQFKSLLDSANAQALSINNNAKSVVGLTFSSGANNSNNLYDVEFPDGTTRYNVTKTELDEITANYNVIFKQLELTLSNLQNLPQFEVNFDASQSIRESSILESVQFQNSGLFVDSSLSTSNSSTVSISSASVMTSSVLANPNILNVSTLSSVLLG